MPKPIPVSSARLQSTFTSSFESLAVASPSAPELNLIYKKCLKQNTSTLLKALQELLEYIQKTDKSQEMVEFLPFWQQIFNRLLLSPDRRVRIQVFIVHIEMIHKVGKQMATILKSIMGLWLNGYFDSKAISNVAKEAMNLAFPNIVKMKSAVEYCLDSLLMFLEDNLFYKSPESLSDSRFVNEIEAQETFSRVISGCIYTLAYIHETCQMDKFNLEFEKIYSNPILWKYLTHKSFIIRHAMYTLVKSLVQSSKLEFLDQNLELISTHFYKQVFTDKESYTQSILWDSLLLLTKTRPQSWILSSQTKTLKRFLQFLKQNCNGFGEIGYPCVLPLVVHLPMELKTHEDFCRDLLGNLWIGLTPTRACFSCFFEVSWYLYKSTLSMESFETLEPKKEEILLYIKQESFINSWKSIKKEGILLFSLEWIHIILVMESLPSMESIITSVYEIILWNQVMEEEEIQFKIQFLKNCFEFWKDSRIIISLLKRELEKQLKNAGNWNLEKDFCCDFYSTLIDLYSQCSLHVEYSNAPLTWVGEKEIYINLMKKSNSRTLSNSFLELIYTISRLFDETKLWNSFMNQIIHQKQVLEIIKSWNFSSNVKIDIVFDEISLQFIQCLLLDVFNNALEYNETESIECIHILIKLKLQNPTNLELNLILNGFLMDFSSTCLTLSIQERIKYIYLFRELELHELYSFDMDSCVLICLFYLISLGGFVNEQEGMLEGTLEDHPFTETYTKKNIQKTLIKVYKSFGSSTQFDFRVKAIQHFKVLIVENCDLEYCTRYLQYLLELLKDTREDLEWIGMELFNCMDFSQFWNSDLCILYPQFVSVSVSPSVDASKGLIRSSIPLAILIQATTCLYEASIVSILHLYLYSYFYSLFLIQLNIPLDTLLDDTLLPEDTLKDAIVKEKKEKIKSKIKKLNRESSLQLLEFAWNQSLNGHELESLVLQFLLKHSPYVNEFISSKTSAEWMELYEKNQFYTLIACTFVSCYQEMIQNVPPMEFELSWNLLYLLKQDLSREKYLFWIQEILNQFKSSPTLLQNVLCVRQGLQFLSCSSLEYLSSLDLQFLNQVILDYLSWSLSDKDSSLVCIYYAIKTLKRLQITREETIHVKLLIEFGGPTRPFTSPLKELQDLICEFGFPESILSFPNLFKSLEPLLYSCNVSIQVTATDLMTRRAQLQVQEWNLWIEMSRLDSNDLDLPLYPFMESEESKSTKNQDESIQEGELNVIRGHLLSWLILMTFIQDSTSVLKSHFISKIRSLEILNPLMSLINRILFIKQQKSNTMLELSKFDLGNYYIHALDESRTSIYTLCSHLYYKLLLVTPSLLRIWWTECKNRSLVLSMQEFTMKFYSPRIISSILVSCCSTKIPDLTIKTSKNTVNVVIQIEDSELDLNISFPSDYPLRQVEIQQSGSRIPGVVESKWRSWLIQSTALLVSQNGSLIDALLLFKKNVDLHFEGVEDCAICYSIIGVMDNTIPSKQCKNCKHKFHSACLFKWFSTSQQSTCPLCRQSSF